MVIVSVSLSDEDIRNLDAIEEGFGLKGRSEAVRVALRTARSDLDDLKGMQGDVEGVLIVVRNNHTDPWLSNIQMNHVGLVTTQLHSHLRDSKCLEVMILSGSASEVCAIISETEGSGKADYIRFVRRRSRVFPLVHTTIAFK